MCGIAAVISARARYSTIVRAEVERMCHRMSVRGPDGVGYWQSVDGQVALGHRRLAIIDLSPRGAQPMQIDGGSLVVTFNGEIYNYRALRRELESQGHVFHSDSDTEVILRLYAERGEDMVNHLRGMFAFAIWDEAKQGLFLARDPFGIKPLYVSTSDGHTRIASEVKALLTIEEVDTAPDPAGHVGFFLWGHVPEPYTLYRGIRALPAGSTMWVEKDGCTRTRQYVDIGRTFADIEKDSADADGRYSSSEELAELLTDSIRHHLVADVEVGVFLSAGRDSNTIAALASDQHDKLKTVTLGFSELKGTSHDETILAEQTATCLGTIHKTSWITSHEFEGERDRLFDRMDQPTIDGINSYFVSKIAAGTGLKVALSGLGGDELLGGYPSFSQIPSLVRTMGCLPGAQTIGRGFRFISAPLLKRVTSPKYAGLLEFGSDYGGAYLLRRGLFMPWELPSLLEPDLVRLGWTELQSRTRLNLTGSEVRDPHLRVAAIEASWYMRNQLLRDTDWASMSHSLEVRVPLVDLQLWRGVAKLRSMGQEISKDRMLSAVAARLPAAIKARPKTGFVVPVREWLGSGMNVGASRGLRGWARLVYASCESQQRPNGTQELDRSATLVS